MKKVYFIACALFIATGSIAQSITQEEKTKALDHLKATQKDLLKSVKGLSEAQLNFKPTPESWSIAECVEHIAISEGNIFGIVQMTLKSEPDPSRRSEVSMSDDQVVGLITSREQKVKTRPDFEPKGNFGDYAGSLKEFSAKRKGNMSFVKTTKEDLRNRYFEFPFGVVDSYQVILFLSGHSQRHTDQIKEIKAHQNFPI